MTKDKMTIRQGLATIELEGIRPPSRIWEPLIPANLPRKGARLPRKVCPSPWPNTHLYWRRPRRLEDKHRGATAQEQAEVMTRA
jgi:hypothetical protein